MHDHENSKSEDAFPPRLCVGVISGTSMDGIDVALVETDGDRLVRPLAGATLPYDAALVAELRGVIADPARAEHGDLDALEAAVTDAHCDAVLAFLAARGVAPQTVALAGLHGQTVFHRPQRRFTRQLLGGARAAARLKIDVVCRFRHADVAAGGEGAPLAPLYHAALARGLPGPLMVLNWGGVGNVTYVGAGEPIAFDTGPANALLDDWTLRHTGAPYDEGGRLAAAGRVDAGVVAALMDNPFFDRPAPKSLDRNEFHARARMVEALSPQDGAATLAAFTVEATAAALRHVPAPPLRWLVCGGGRLNATLMGRLAARLGVPVEPVEAVGWNGDHLEAELFAWLAARSRRGLPLSLPTTTGVPRPMPGGAFFAATK
jgi:anhydro-N-acetylmuramic acid kinase